MTKAERTKTFILEKVSPVFNRMGYSATSLSDIMDATGLTKGSIYGNFKNKEDLALAAFNYNVRSIMTKIRVITDEIESPIAKLFALSNFYREYYKHQLGFGGCPILNVGVDSVNVNQRLHHRVKEVTQKIQLSIEGILRQGQARGEIKESIDPKKYSGRIFSILEGAIFMSTLMKEDGYLMDMMNHLDEMIDHQLRI